VKAAIERANLDSRVKVIVLQGEGKSFCAGYDLKLFAENASSVGSQQAKSRVWDPMLDYMGMKHLTDCLTAVWKSFKPVVAKVRGSCVAGGTDLALSCDLVFAEHTSTFGYPPARVWGCPTAAMWIYRLGLERSKRMILTGDIVTGKTAAQIGLISASCEPAELDRHVDHVLQRMTSMPLNQLV